MELIYTKSESTIRPKEIEVGVTTVWFRKNVVKTQRHDSMDSKESITMYVYDEAKLSKDEAILYLTEMLSQQGANIDYLSMMTDVDLPSEDGDV